MTIYDVVMKLIGKVNPVGSTQVDAERYENLKALTELVDELLTDIDSIATANKDRHECSMKKAGKHCCDFLDSIGIKP